MTVRITNIQHFCLQDGPGIRTTIFLKGCNLTCPWCCNPENISYDFQEYNYNNQVEVFGYDINLEDLEKEILKDNIYYSKNNGGVTFSGGEPLLQINDLEPLLKELKKLNINICFETALQVPQEYLETSLKYVDEYFVDIKILSKVHCEKILNGNVDLFKSNLKLLIEKNSNVTFRIPLINEFTLKEDNMDLIYELLREYPNQKVEIFKTHNLGEKKYKVLNKKPFPHTQINDEKIGEIKDKINQIVEECEIIKI